MPGSGSAGGPSFAQFLNDQPALPAPPAHADATPREPEAREPAPPPAAANPNVRRQAAPAPTPAKPAAPARSSAADATPPARTDTRAVADDAGNDEGDTRVGSTDSPDKPETAGLDEFNQLIGLTTPVAPATMPVQGTVHAGHAGPAKPEEPADDRKPAVARVDIASSSPTERRPAEAPAREPAARAQAAEAGIAAADKPSPRSTDALQAASGTGAGSAPHPAAGSAEAGTPNFAALLAQTQLPPGAMPDAAPLAASGQVHAALHSSAFAPELAASVSLLAADGVQQAELQLNPADMGPVAVQIVVDGAQAQVSFHAVHAETRQALEQSLPDLAAALQGQGLTLSGGGVFQQAARDPDHGQGERGDSGGRSTSRAGSAAPVRRSVGLLDTFA
jgi:flagellar hook-length control protein FliK